MSDEPRPGHEAALDGTFRVESSATGRDGASEAAEATTRRGAGPAPSGRSGWYGGQNLIRGLLSGFRPGSRPGDAAVGDSSRNTSRRPPAPPAVSSRGGSGDDGVDKSQFDSNGGHSSGRSSGRAHSRHSDESGASRNAAQGDKRRIGRQGGSSHPVGDRLPRRESDDSASLGLRGGDGGSSALEFTGSREGSSDGPSGFRSSTDVGSLHGRSRERRGSRAEAFERDLRSGHHAESRSPGVITGAGSDAGAGSSAPFQGALLSVLPEMEEDGRPRTGIGNTETSTPESHGLGPNERGSHGRGSHLQDMASHTDRQREQTGSRWGSGDGRAGGNPATVTAAAAAGGGGGGRSKDFASFAGSNSSGGTGTGAGISSGIGLPRIDGEPTLHQQQQQRQHQHQQQTGMTGGASLVRRDSDGAMVHSRYAPGADGRSDLRGLEPMSPGSGLRPVRSMHAAGPSRGRAGAAPAPSSLHVGMGSDGRRLTGVGAQTNTGAGMIGVGDGISPAGSSAAPSSARMGSMEGVRASAVAAEEEAAALRAELDVERRLSARLRADIETQHSVLQRMRSAIEDLKGKVERSVTESWSELERIEGARERLSASIAEGVAADVSLREEEAELAVTDALHRVGGSVQAELVRLRADADQIKSQSLTGSLSQLSVFLVNLLARGASVLIFSLLPSTEEGAQMFSAVFSGVMTILTLGGLLMATPTSSTSTDSESLAAAGQGAADSAVGAVGAVEGNWSSRDDDPPVIDSATDPVERGISGGLAGLKTRPMDKDTAGNPDSGVSDRDPVRGTGRGRTTSRISLAELPEEVGEGYSSHHHHHQHRLSDADRYGREGSSGVAAVDDVKIGNASELRQRAPPARRQPDAAPLRRRSRSGSGSGTGAHSGRISAGVGGRYGRREVNASPRSNISSGVGRPVDEGRGGRWGEWDGKDTSAFNQRRGGVASSARADRDTSIGRSDAGYRDSRRKGPPPSPPRPPANHSLRSDIDRRGYYDGRESDGLESKDDFGSQGELVRESGDGASGTGLMSRRGSRGGDRAMGVGSDWIGRPDERGGGRRKQEQMERGTKPGAVWQHGSAGREDVLDGQIGTRRDSRRGSGAEFKERSWSRERGRGSMRAAAEDGSLAGHAQLESAGRRRVDEEASRSQASSGRREVESAAGMRDVVNLPIGRARERPVSLAEAARGRLHAQKHQQRPAALASGVTRGTSSRHIGDDGGRPRSNARDNTRGSIFQH